MIDRLQRQAAEDIAVLQDIVSRIRNELTQAVEEVRREGDLAYLEALAGKVVIELALQKADTAVAEAKDQVLERSAVERALRDRAWQKFTGETVQSFFSVVDIIPPAMSGLVEALLAYPPAYRKVFKDATPDMPANWIVHHTKQQAIADRYLNEGIDIHDTKYLRGVPPEVHKEINALQQKWWYEQVRKNNKIGNLKEAFQKVPMEDILAFEKKLDKLYSGYWLEAGKGQKRKVQQILKRIGPNGALFTTGKASRLKKLGFAVAALGFFELFVRNGQALANIANHNPQQLAAYNAFVGSYESALEEATTIGRVRYGTAFGAKEDFIRYLDSLELQDDAIEQISGALELGLGLMLLEP